MEVVAPASLTCGSLSFQECLYEPFLFPRPTGEFDVFVLPHEREIVQSSLSAREARDVCFFPSCTNSLCLALFSPFKA